MSSNCVASQSYWDSLYKCLEKYLRYEPQNILFRDLYSKYIKQGGTCFEIGCYPGNNLLFFAKEYGYSVSGMDITPKVLSELPAYLTANGVQPEKLICQDFNTYHSLETYDLVCSFGFIEHFVNFEEIIVKHIQMVKRGGILVITCPNFTGLQYVLQLVIDRRWLSSHVTDTMNLRKWRRILEKNHMRLLYHNYYKTAGFVGGPEKPKTRFQRWISRKVDRLFSEIDAHISFPNSLLSPWIVSISQRYL